MTPSKEITLAILSQFLRPYLVICERGPHDFHVGPLQDAQNTQEIIQKLYGERDYNPNHGYEPYWIGGDWVFKRPEIEEGVTVSSTRMPQVCGDECYHLYQGIREVCGREVRNINFGGCRGNIFGWCYGDYIDDHTMGYQTFPSYCAFLDRQCKDEIINIGWQFVHVGKCPEKQEEVLKNIQKPRKVLDRLHKQYIPDVNKNAIDMSLPPPFT